ncbi:MAG: gliding motility-associated C-terminal domain-containing protein [Bacteroidota bacterium]
MTPSAPKIVLVFSLWCVAISLHAQFTIQDCLGAIPVCQDVYTEDQSPVGEGNVPNEIIPGETCTAGEISSIWYIFTANEDGELGFVISPNDQDDDYDWALFDLTNASCDELFEENLVSCNAAGGTGCHGDTGCIEGGIGNYTTGGCGGTGPFNDLVPMQEGNTYVLMVSNWSQSPNGYTLDFSGSTGLGIFDETPPLVDDISNLPASCGDDSFALQFNEFILCNSVNADAFQLTGPGGPYTLSVSSPNCNAGGTQTRNLNFTISPPVQAMGEYTFTIATNSPNDLLDLCDNQAADFTFTFNVDVPLPVNINIGQDTSLLCDGDDLLLDASDTGGISYLWEDGSTEPTLLVNSGGVYAVTVTEACGVGEDEIEVFVQMTPPSVELGDNQIRCPGEVVNLDADNGLAFYNWQDGSTNPTLSVDGTGDYAVTVTNGCGTVEDAVNITYVPPLNLSLATEYVLCLGDTLPIELERPFATYAWSDGSTAAERDITQNGNYTVTVTTPCEQYEAAFDAIFLEDPKLELGENSILCPNDSLLLNTSIPGSTYAWQDGSIEPTFLVTQPGLYRVTVSTVCSDLTDSVFVDYTPVVTTNLGRDTFLCEGIPYDLDATSAGEVNYRWDDGSLAPQRRVFGPDTYVVTVTSPCETVVDTLQIDVCEICTAYWPNAFSPNLDGVNDTFKPESFCPLTGYELQLFDRWGRQVFVSNDPLLGWDGRQGGQLAPQGVYVWMATYVVLENGYPRAVQERGDIVVVR